MSSNKKILILPGDGIGIEVMNEVLNIIDWMAKNKSIEFDTDYGTEGLVYVQQPQALPMTILGIYPRLETESV